jgi:hypothetical protein
MQQQQQQQQGFQTQPGGSQGFADPGLGLIKSEGGTAFRAAQPQLHTLARGRHGSGSHPPTGQHPFSVSQPSALGQYEGIYHDSPEDGEEDDVGTSGDEGHDSVATAGVAGEKASTPASKSKKGAAGKPAVASSTGSYGAGLGSLGLNKEKRKRQVQSCSECRRRKIKCDKK